MSERSERTCPIGFARFIRFFAAFGHNKLCPYSRCVLALFEAQLITVIKLPPFGRVGVGLQLMAFCLLKGRLLHAERPPFTMQNMTFCREPVRQRVTYRLWAAPQPVRMAPSSGYFCLFLSCSVKTLLCKRCNIIIISNIFDKISMYLEKLRYFCIVLVERAWTRLPKKPLT